MAALINCMHFILILSTQILAASAISCGLVPVSSNEYNALFEFFNSTGGPRWTNSLGWVFDNNLSAPCSIPWFGLICESVDSASCSVTEINLESNSLSGTIPSQIANLSYVTIFNVQNNNLRGTIPTEIGLLKYLNTLFLYENVISGTIPTEFKDLGSLQFLYLNRNYHLNGTIPTELGQMSSLIFLYLDYNLLTGTIPSQLGNLSNLNVLDLNGNHLTSTIPPEICQLKNLQNLYLQNNSLSNSVPSYISSISEFLVIFLFDNFLTGTLPDLPVTMSEVYIYNNYMTGPILFQIYSHSLSLLYAESNFFTGSLPVNYSCNPYLNELEISSNLFTGPIVDLCLPVLEGLILANNSFTGAVPANFSEFMPNLIYMDLSNNSFTGGIPSYLFNKSSLATIILANNNMTSLQGTFFGPQLVTLIISNNKISSPFPTNLGNLSIFAIDSNRFHGNISTSNCSSIQKMEQLYVGSNLLVGNLSSCGCFKNLTVLNVENNAFTGSLQFLDETPLMQELIASKNKLTGTLPLSISKMSKLQLLLLQSNLFTGNPNSIFSASVQTLLTAVDISNNDFTGPIPPTPFTLPLMQSFGAAKTCFSGELPITICYCTSLEVLLMDGVTSGVSCQKRFNFIRTSDAYISTKGPVAGMIPDCLWNLPSLRTVHLSSNGLTGTIGNFNSLSNLTTVVLSYNQLSGTIPIELQSLKLLSLQLNSNRFKGTYSGRPEINSSVVYLQNNRLSGYLPNFLDNATEINVMEGNLFNCDEAHPVPLYDPNANATNCGSSQLDESLIVWGVGVFLIAILLLTILKFGNIFDWPFVMVGRVLGRFRNIKSYSLLVGDICDMMTIRRPSQIYSYSFLVIKFLVFIVFSFLFFSVIVCIPTFALFKSSQNGLFSTHTYQYQWNVSAAFLTGLTPTILLIVIWLLLVLTMLYWFYWHLGVDKSPSSSVSENELSTTANFWKNLILCTCILLVHVCMMSLINVGYLFVTLFNNYPVSIKNCAIVATAVFKSLWNDALFPFCSRYVFASKLSMSWMTTLQFLIILLSFLVIPFIVSLLINSLCFLDLLVPQSDISTSFFYNLASRHTCQTFPLPSINETFHFPDNDVHPIVPEKPVEVTSCVSFSPTQTLLSDFYPPFVYSYQCGSSILTSYIPVVMLSITFRMMQLIVWVVALHEKRKYIVGSSHLKDLIFHYLEVYSVGIAHPLTTLKVGDRLLDSANHLSTQLQCILTMLTFGLASPPLAAVVCIFQVLDTCVHLHLIRDYMLLSPRCAREPVTGDGTSLEDGNTVNQGDYSGGLDNSCSGVWHACRPCLWLGIYSSSIFWGLILFDMVGDMDVHHPLKAIWTLIVMPLIPLLLHLLSLMITAWQKWKILQDSIKATVSRAISMKGIITSRNNPLLSVEIVHPEQQLADDFMVTRPNP